MNRLQKHTMSNLNIIALFDMHLLIFFVFLYVCCFFAFHCFRSHHVHHPLFFCRFTCGLLNLMHHLKINSITINNNVGIYVLKVINFEILAKKQ